VTLSRSSTPAGSPAGVPASAAAPLRQQSTATERRVAEAAAIGVMVIWAGNFIVVKASIGELPPIGFSFLRFLLAGIVLLVICRVLEGSVGVPRREALPLAALGAIGFGAYQILWTTALVNTTAGDSALLIAATPIFTMPRLGRDRL
jgi:drug/metabolite transporter (DMT)-like permease